MSLSISSATSTQNTTQTKKKGNGGPPSDILADLQKYGLSPQGSEQADRAAIQQAKAREAQQKKAQQQQQQQGNQENTLLTGTKNANQGNKLFMMG